MFKGLLNMISKSKKSRDSHVNEPQAPGPLTLDNVLREFEDCSDLNSRSYPELKVELLYFSHLLDKDLFERDVITPLENIQPDGLQSLLEQSNFTKVKDASDAVSGILKGSAALFTPFGVYLVLVYGPMSRSIEQSTTESVIIGPHDAFTESIETNLSLIRRKLPSNQLKVLQFEVGEISKTKVCLCYIDGIANMEYVEEMSTRIKNVEYSYIADGSMFSQFIKDHPNSVFPVFQTSDRTDLAVSKLCEGKLLVITDHSPSVITAPSSFFEFFTSPDDYFTMWPTGTFQRILRYLGFVITISLTSLYVAITTYHYEMIPQNLLESLTESRSRVPFPPLIEALIMEITIEMLREAGARLPTKVGQTIGIVGGIVIGTAAVQAGFTSNILIIAIALSAIASFVVPSYTMSGSIRLVRFGILILTGMLGNFGFFAGLAILIIHLSNLTSLGAPYMIPAAPIKPADWLDIFIRGPFWSFKKRPSQSRTSNIEINKMRK